MSILVTHAGRHGDCLWALPTVRAIAETCGEPVDFCISKKYGGLVPLIQEQDYIRTAFSDMTWEIQESAPISPPEPPLEHRPMGGGKYDKTIHLSFRGWPEAPTLAEGYWLNGQRAEPGIGVMEKGLDLGRPWIRVPEPQPCDYTVGFTDEYFEMKYGIACILSDDLSPDWVARGLAAPGSRWQVEGGTYPTSWLEAAEMIAGARVFLGCLGGLAVLAAALGKPRVLVEPNEQRHHPVFQHWDTELVKGGDGKPTFDARHVAEVVRGRLEGGGGGG